MDIGEKKLRAMDAVVHGPLWLPRQGWHDDHVKVDGTPDYKPAVMQVSAEFLMLAAVLAERDLIGGRFLQLGVGECGASHALWCALFDGGGVTIDRNGLYVDTGNEGHRVYGGDTHDTAMQDRVKVWAPYDFLFIDAGHDMQDVMLDHKDYGPMVRPGGIIAFHDALPRYAYPEIEVWQYLRHRERVTHLCASDVGVAYIVKEKLRGPGEMAEAILEEARRPR